MGGLTGLRRYTWWSVPGASAAVLVAFAVPGLVRPETPGWARAAGLAALAVTVTATVLLLSRRLNGGPLPVGWLAIGGAGAMLEGLGDPDRWVIAPATVLAAWASFLPARTRWALLGTAALAVSVPGLVTQSAYAALFPPGVVAFAAWATLGPLWVWDVAGELAAARRSAAELAVADERLRFAADLHDIQGHHLQVIALKAELAARLTDVDPQRAAAEMLEVQHLSATALQETRGLVQGYRRTTLAAEIANATRMLASADIDARLTIAPADELPAADRHLLGLVMREATTNVLRHSRAVHAGVDYRVESGRARLEVRNDGLGTAPASGIGTGTGLSTLAERLHTAGGDLHWHRDGAEFVLTASFPVTTARPVTVPAPAS